MDNVTFERFPQKSCCLIVRSIFHSIDFVTKNISIPGFHLIDFFRSKLALTNDTELLHVLFLEHFYQDTNEFVYFFDWQLWLWLCDYCLFFVVSFWSIAYWVRIATKIFTKISIPSLKSKRFNGYVHCRLFCWTNSTKMLSLNRRQKVNCENCGTQSTLKEILRFSKEDVLLEPFHIPLVATSEHFTELNWNVTLTGKFQKQLIEVFRDAKKVMTIFTVFTSCENIKGSKMEHRKFQEAKMLMLKH